MHGHLKKRHSYDPTRPFFCWACGFARNEVLKHVRDTSRGSVHFSEKLVEELDDIRWVAVDGELRRISPLYSQLLHDYLEDEEADFETATCDWA